MAAERAVPQDLESPLIVHSQDALEAVRSLLVHIGEDPMRSGLLDTPRRVLQGLAEMTEGYLMNPAEILATKFPDGSPGQWVELRGIAFASLCEHHLLPFWGTVDIAYCPAESWVFGLSKLARLVECFARRLQVQERLTCQLANALLAHMDCTGIFVQVRAQHYCLCGRGVNKPGAEMVTTDQRGKPRP